MHVENALVYYQELKNAKVPAEMHIHAKGGHGYGLRRTALPVTTWPDILETWPHMIDMLTAEYCRRNKLCKQPMRHAGSCCWRMPISGNVY